MRRAGLALAVIGLIDIASCIAAVVNRSNYSSSLNVFALAAGVMVYRGSTGTARWVIKGLSFLLGTLLLLFAMIPVIMPPRLLWLQVKTSPFATIGGLGALAALLAALSWVRTSLASLPLYPAGLHAPALYRARGAWLGASVAAAVAIFLAVFLRGPFARRAIAEAKQRVGADYSFFVREMRVAGGRGSAVVLAYSDKEVREVPVRWNDE